MRSTRETCSISTAVGAAMHKQRHATEDGDVRVKAVVTERNWCGCDIMVVVRAVIMRIMSLHRQPCRIDSKVDRCVISDLRCVAL